MEKSEHYLKLKNFLKGDSVQTSLMPLRISFLTRLKLLDSCFILILFERIAVEIFKGSKTAAEGRKYVQALGI